MQETSDWRTHGWNVMSEQRKSNWQHPNTYYRDREETPGTDECDTGQYSHPYRTLPTKAVQIMADQARDVVLESVHFLVEIGNPSQLLTFSSRVRERIAFFSATGRVKLNAPRDCIDQYVLPAASQSLLQSAVPHRASPMSPRSPLVAL
jgi:hypothetical protein